MPEDEKVVQEEQVSTEETASKVEATEEQKTEEQTKAQPLDEARIQQLIAQEVELARRQLQSDKDRAVSEVRREAERKVRLAESKASAYESSFAGLDEDTRKEAELAKLRGQAKYFDDIQREEAVVRQQEQFKENLKQSLRDEVATLGIDPEDKRLDYALDESDYFEGRKRFTASVSKIVKEKDNEVLKQAETRFKALEAEFRKEHGLDLVDKSGGSAIDEGDESFMKKMADPNYVDTKEDRERIDKIQKKRRGG